MKAADLFVRALEQEGVEYIFGIPGEENLDLLEALVDSSIQLIVTRHEQAAGFMAATYGRLTGRPGVCLATLGPGATNLVTAAGYAQLGAMPMVMITGQKPIRSSKQGQFQILDVVDMMQPLTKYTQQIVSAANIPSRVREAFRRAQEERPGACHLELPEDIAREEVEAPLLQESYVRRPIAEEKAVRAAVNAIETSRRPLLMIGAAANRRLTCKMLREFVERTGIPFVATQMGKGVLSEAHPLSIGNAALSDGDFVHRAVADADLIVNVGHDVVEKPPFFMHPDGRTVIHVNFFSAAVDPVYFPQLEVVGDIANSIWQMREAIAPQPHWDFSRFLTVKKAVDSHIAECAHENSFPILPQQLVHEVRNIMPSDGIIALDNGMYKIWFARNYRAEMPNTVLLDNALASMGAGLPSALAARMVHPHRKVLAICGDGGFMMNSQELETAVRLNLQVVVLVLRDNGYGMIKWKQRDMDMRNFGLDFGNPDFVRYAESYGAKGYRIDSTNQLTNVLTECLESEGVHVIELPVDYSENERVISKEIHTRSAQLEL